MLFCSVSIHNYLQIEPFSRVIVAASGLHCLMGNVDSD